MMSVTATPTPYGLFQESLAEGRIDFRNDPLMCMIVKAGYVFSRDAHKFRSIISNEVTGSGYVTGGKQVTGVALAYSGSTRKLVINGGPLAWPSVTWTGAKGAVLYVAREDVPITAQPLMAYLDFGTVQNRSDEPFYITFPTTGIMSIGLP